MESNPNFTVYVDSPLALEATQIYDGDLTGYADEETIELLKNGFKPISFPGLKLSRTSQESMALNTDPTPKVIIASSGMCEAGTHPAPPEAQPVAAGMFHRLCGIPE